jgi:opacity protein-like surface antigen
MTRILLSAVIVCSVGAASVAHAQDRWMIELRGGATQATDTFLATDLRTGVGFEGNVGIRVAPGTFVYGGWDWQHHRAKSPLFGRMEDVEDTGYAFGLRIVPAIASPVKPWVRGGALFNHIEIEDDEGSLVADSEHTWGWEIGGGLDLSFGGSWSLTPGLRYRRFEPDVRFGATRTPATLGYVTYDVGIAWKF